MDNFGKCCMDVTLTNRNDEDVECDNCQCCTYQGFLCNRSQSHRMDQKATIYPGIDLYELDRSNENNLAGDFKIFDQIYRCY